MTKPPGTELAYEYVRRRQQTAVEKFATDNDRDISDEADVVGAREEACLRGVREDVSPTLKHGVPTDEGTPTRVYAEHRGIPCPERVHRLVVAIVKRAIERLVRSEHVFFHDGMITA